MIYFIKIYDTKTKESDYIMHYDHHTGELLLTKDVVEKQEYLSSETLLEELNALINSAHFNLRRYKITIGAY